MRCIAAALCLLLGSSVQPARAADDLARACAAEARYPTPEDPTGKEFDKLEPGVAIPICEAALKADPDDYASEAYLGRALGKAERYDEAYPHLRRAAEAGNVLAMRQLALNLESGRGVQKDEAAAFALMKRAAEAGYAPAMDSLSSYFVNGTGVSKDDIAAVAWLQKASDLGYAIAINNLAVAFEQGEGVAKDEAEATRLYKLAADKGVSVAMRNVGLAYLNGRGVAQDYETASAWFRKAIAGGDVEAYEALGNALSMDDNPLKDYSSALDAYRAGDEAGASGSTYQLGLMYMQGQAVPQDYAEARRWLGKAVDNGSTDALVELGLMAERGMGIPADPGAAVDLYRQAADQGNGRAMRMLGINYAYSIGVERDYSQALDWFRKGTEAGDIESFAEIGRAYENGTGVAQDLSQAVQWYEKGHAAGASSATTRLALMLANGTGGLIKDLQRAAMLLREAANAGDADAMWNLADAYFWGRGIPQDHSESERWMIKAANISDGGYKQWLGERYFKGDRVVIDLAKARKLFEAADALGEPVAGEWLVRATLADAGFANRDKLAAATLEEKAAKEQGWALAALAFPGPAVAILSDRIDSAKWREAVADVKDPSTLLAMSKALMAGSLARQDFGLALKMASLAGGDDTFGAMEHQLGLLADLRLTRAALSRYERFLESAEFQAATQARQDSFKRYFINRMAGRWQADDRSLEALIRISNQGASGATTAIGDFYAADDNPRRDYARAEIWYRKAVDQGDMVAAIKLGVMYGTGRGRAEDPASAMEYYRRAANAGHPTARANLGYMYLAGRGVPQDDDEAARWYALAAEDGDINAKYALALMRFAGRGGAANPTEAIRLLRDTIDCAHEASRVLMARAYFEGAGVERNPEEGLRWMKLAATYPKSDGQIGMAQAAVFGWGMKPDISLARSYLVNARKLGNPDAARWLELCGQNATLGCLRDAPGFRPDPLMRERAKTPPIATPTFADEERRLRSALTIAITENRSEYEITTAFIGLEQLYMLYGKTDAAVTASLNRVIQREAQLARLYGQSDNYFALFDASCSWSNASRNAAAQGHEEAAVLFAKVAVNKLQQARAYIADLDDDIRECFVEAHRDRYRQLAGTFLQMGRFEEAENVLSMLKDFEHSTWTSGMEGRGRSLAMMPLTRKQAEALAAIERAATANATAALSRTLGASVPEAEQAFETALVEASKLVISLENRPSSKLMVSASDRPRRVADALVSLGRPGVAALQAVAGPQHLHWLLTTPTAQQHIQVPISLATVAGQVRAYRYAINDVDPNAAQLGKALYDAVFAEVDTALKAQGITEVLLSLDDVLRYVPFAALHDGKGWLVERYAFSSFRDASDLGAATTRRDWDVAGFGTTRAVGGFDELPETEKELAGIVAERGGLLPGTIALDDAFSASALRSAVAGDAAVIHIASHFILDSRMSANSFLLLGTGDTLPLSAFGKSGDIRFRHADFLALSACETGLAAPDAKGVEIESMAEIAQNAGAPAVLASLWEVADQSTSRLMISFYRHRNEGSLVSKAAALRQAQLDLIAEGVAQLARFSGNAEEAPPDFTHPFFWAPFILLGDAS